MDAINLDSGALCFTLADKKTGEQKECSVDVYLLAIVCEECVEEHKLAIVEGQYKTTSAFLRDLTERLIDLGVDGCTPTVALALWNRSGQEVERLKKNTSPTPTSDSGTALTPPASTPNAG